MPNTPTPLYDHDLSPRRRTFDERFLPLMEGFALFVTSHWLALMNAALFVFSGLPVLSPILEAGDSPVGQTLGSVIFVAYRATCHQLPNRSFFIMGHQVAWCERDAAIWTALLLGGLLFGFVRHRLRSPDMWLYALLILPMAIDGTTQLFGVRESNWELRVITGTLFGLASAWLVLPILERGMNEVRASLEVGRGSPEPPAQ